MGELQMVTSLHVITRMTQETILKLFLGKDHRVFGYSMNWGDKVLEYARPCGRHLRKKRQSPCREVLSCTSLVPHGSSLHTIFQSESQEGTHSCAGHTRGVCSTDGPARAPPTLSNSKKHVGKLGSENNDISGFILNSF